MTHHLDNETLQALQEMEERQHQLLQEIQQGSRITSEEQLWDTVRRALQKAYGPLVSKELVDQYTAKLIEEGILS